MLYCTTLLSFVLCFTARHSCLLYCALLHDTLVFVAGLIKFFGNVAQLWPKEVFAEYPNVVTALFETFDNPDLVLLGVAMETVGYIGTSVEGKYMLDSLGMTYL